VRLAGILLLFLISVAPADQEHTDFIQKEVEWGKPLSLEEFGIPHISVFMVMREMTFILASINRQYSVRVELKSGNAVRLPGTNSSMYLLYEEPGKGIRVYFLEAIAKMNHDLLVVAVTKRTEQAAPSPIRSTLAEWYTSLQQDRAMLDTSRCSCVSHRVAQQPSRPFTERDYGCRLSAS